MSFPCYGQQENDFSAFLEKQLEQDEAALQKRLLAASNGTGKERKLDSVLASKRKEGLAVTLLTLKRLEEAAANKFPSIQAFCQQLRKEGVLPDPSTPVDEWNDFVADDLTIKNPNFWRAYFEVAAGHGLMELVHCSLLKAEGQCMRSLQNSVVARMGKHPQSLESLHVKNATSNQNVLSTAMSKINNGIKSFESKKFDDAADEFKAIIKTWPECGLASFELGLTIYHKREFEAGREIPRVAQLPVGHPSRPSEETYDLYKTARTFDPMIRNAYQGPDTSKQLVVMAKSVVPAYRKLSDLSKNAKPGRDLAVFGLGCQMVGHHDYAIFARQVFVSSKGQVDEKDLKYFEKSLSQLIDEEATKSIIESLSKDDGKRFYFKPIASD